MDSNYPNRIDNFQTKENEQGAQYDPQETTVQFAEDINKTNGAIKNVQETLGTNPAGKYRTVSEYLVNIDEVANKPVEVLTKLRLKTIRYNNGNFVFNFGQMWLRVGDRLIITSGSTLSIPEEEGPYSVYLTSDYQIAVSFAYMDEIVQDPENNLLLPIAEMYLYYWENKVQFDRSNYFSGAVFQPYLNDMTIGRTLSNNDYGTKTIGNAITQSHLTPGMSYIAFLQLSFAQAPDKITVIANGDTDDVVDFYPDETNAKNEFVMIGFRADAEGEVKIEFTIAPDVAGQKQIGRCTYFLQPVDDWN